MRRLAFEIGSQFYAIGTVLLDRILVTGILIRAWGVEGFEYWSLVLAATTLLSLAEAGAVMNFSNRISNFQARGESRLAVASYRQSNLILLAIALVVTAVAGLLAGFGILQRLVGLSSTVAGANSTLILLCLGASVAIRIVFSNSVGVYRAHLAYGRYVLLQSTADLVRILGIAAIVVLGGSLNQAAAAFLLLTFTGFALILTDQARRWPGYRYRFARRRDDVLRGSVRQSLQFGLPYFPNLALTQGPVLMLGATAGLGGGVIGSFVLLRTMANLARTVVYQFVNVCGMEIARREQRDDPHSPRYLRSARLAAALSFGTISGTLLAYGSELLQIWTGHAELYRGPVLAAMLLPFLITPSYILCTTILQYQNRAVAWSVGTYAQLGLAMVFYLIVPIDDVVFRLAVSIFGAELIGLALPVLWDCSGRRVAAAIGAEAPFTLIALGSAAGILALSWVLGRVVGQSSLRDLVVHGLVIAPLYGLLLWLTVRRELAAIRRLRDPGSLELQEDRQLVNR